MKILNLFLLIIFLFLFNSCQTIENKSQETIKKENQKLSTKEKAFYDAAGDAKKWLFYPPTTVLTLATSSGSYFVVTGHHPLESITASIISVFGLVVPYYGFKYLDKNQDVEISPEDIQRYKRIYSKEFKKIKYNNI